MSATDNFLAQIADREYEEGVAAEVEAFLKAHPYDRRVVRALLKLYQAYPAVTNYDVLAECLAKALLAPSTDLLSFRYLLPLGLAERDARFQAVFALSDMLETGRYSEMWAKVGEQPFASVAGFTESLRRVVVASIAETCRSLPKSIFCSLAGVSDAQLEALKSASPEIVSVSGDLVTFKEADGNTAHNKQFSEIRFEEVKILCLE